MRPNFSPETTYKKVRTRSSDTWRWILKAELKTWDDVRVVCITLTDVLGFTSLYDWTQLYLLNRLEIFRNKQSPVQHHLTVEWWWRQPGRPHSSGAPAGRIFCQTQSQILSCRAWEEGVAKYLDLSLPTYHTVRVSLCQDSTPLYHYLNSQHVTPTPNLLSTEKNGYPYKFARPAKLTSHMQFCKVFVKFLRSSLKFAKYWSRPSELMHLADWSLCLRPLSR